MVNFITNLFNHYKRSNIPMRFIYINGIVFLATWLLSLILLLFHLRGEEILDVLKLPTQLELLVWQPWSLVTYMFMHANLLHLLFNMLWLFWFGQLFLYFYSERAFGGLYLFGGLCGGVLYLFCYNLAPLFGYVATNHYLLGASASILAITVATAAKAPNFKIRLFLFGEWSLKYIAILMVAMDLLLMTSDNAGGHIAHLGGALGGIWYALMLRKGIDLTGWINNTLDLLSNWSNRLFRRSSSPRRPKMKATRHMNDYEYRKEKTRKNEEIDRILDKLRQSGYSSLTTDEKKSLFDASKR